MRLSRGLIGLLAFLAGSAALSWEVLWQHCSSLFLGASALGAAITLAVMMVGMTVGAVGGGRLIGWIRARGSDDLLVRPLRIYAGLEAVVGLSGLLLLPGFSVLEWFDRWLFVTAPAALQLGHAVGLVAVLGIPAVAMGATLPALRLVASASGASLSRLYGLNTFGAAVGALGVAFFAVPAFGIESTSHLAAAVNLTVALVAFLAGRGTGSPAPIAAVVAATPSRTRGRYLVVSVTGFATFALEVLWFRAMRAAFLSETDAFAIMLCVVLVPLAVGAALAPALARRAWALEGMLAAAAAVVLLSAPFVERFDLLTTYPDNYVVRLLTWFATGLAVVGPSVLLLGLPLPLLLDRSADPASTGRVYAVNTLAAALGSLTTAWILLPRLGLAHAIWLVGVLLVGAAVLVAGPRRRIALGLAGAAALAVAALSQSDVGRLRVRGPGRRDPVPVLAYREGPDVTAAVIAPPGSARLLIIDGFVASSEESLAQYMEWMGRLPMILHPNPQRALVICYGTGQTANAVRNEAPASVDVVELNADVLAMAPLFTSSEALLDDRRVHPIVMDGRAWLRRTDHTYDVVTLEPMPPNFVGVNALYSREFYELMATRLNPGGIVAQWVPYHLVTPSDAAAIAATFLEVFPDAILWNAPTSQTGILVGRRAGQPQPLGQDWPGLRRPGVKRTLTPAEIVANIALRQAELAHYSAAGVVITDDNQRLAYSRTRAVKHQNEARLNAANLAMVERYKDPRDAK